ncbi:uncharacterized protein AC631_04014 [Debaryomyces fabryi]|uniref:F-box domain-containing protein n=1 Tax=Debaryomyces fabryi TaxID=58627 RepID=A0A0V1PVE7_9ASCO|nr:uncharacterized protein AC631_04014 [Debaryomyces fabryi]KSA00222.1 hypothetical protein AC631_04014 [Debaryomyces fabryi]CUM54608.1 unnamed protein product [Debaryomyces fabryi]
MTSHSNPVVTVSPIKYPILTLEPQGQYQNSYYGRLCNKQSNQPNDSILKKLPSNLVSEIFQHVDQFDLVNLLLTCTDFYAIAIERLYKRVTVILNAEYPTRYNKNSKLFIRENGIKYMDSALIVSIEKLLTFIKILHVNPYLIQKVKFFVFDKCYSDNLLKQGQDLSLIQSEIIEFFGKNSYEMNFLHITFVDFVTGIEKLTKFLSHENIRNKIFKLFVTSYKDLYLPVVPQGLTNLFLMLDEVELMSIDKFDLLNPPYDVFNSIFTLTCSTNNQFGLEILRKIHLVNNDDEDSKLKLKGLTVFHCHNESITSDENDVFNSISNNNKHDLEYQNYVQSLDKSLLFKVISDKINLTYLTHLYLKIDCIERRNYNCNCFSKFFKDLAAYLVSKRGLPNLISFELELFPNLEWLRPHQILENILTPLGVFVKTLSNLSRLTIDFSTPGFKMFDSGMGMSSLVLNKLNERLMEAFFLCFFTSNQLRIISNLRTLQLPDFLTSFIYYKPAFYESLLHTCQCWGCSLVLDKLSDLFFPLNEDAEIQEMNDEATFYILIGFILGKLQADREVCIPIKQTTFNYKNYPIYKGQPHTLHNHFHRGENSCKCNIKEDINGESKLNIDNLVTTYIIHQLKPILQYLSMIFFKLDNLMIHGIYYEYDQSTRRLKPIFDDEQYPPEFLEERAKEIKSGKIPDLPFGYFRKG